MKNWGLEKLMGLNFKIAYKKGKENVVANALSRNITQGTLAHILLSHLT